MEPVKRGLNTNISDKCSSAIFEYYVYHECKEKSNRKKSHGTKVTSFCKKKSHRKKKVIGKKVTLKEKG